MAPRASDRLKALQERAAALVSPVSETPADGAAAPDANAALVAANTHFGGALDQLVRTRAIQHIPLEQIAPDTRPDMHQPRLLPLPEQLVAQGQPLAEYRELVAELVTLGESLKERQIQPIVVFPGTSSAQPSVRYLILVGQRRWTAAHLVGLKALDAIVVEPPTPAERVLIQYAENEEREEFSDMERAWSLHQMKQALNDAPWEEVETRLHMSRARRQQLLRLMAFSPTQQRRVALLRLQETQARTLHSAVRAGELTPAQVDGILERLTKIAAERSEHDVRVEPTGGRASPRRSGIDGPTVARLVARTRRAAAHVPTQMPPRWLPTLHTHITRANQGLQRSLDRIETLNAADVETLRAELAQLQDLVGRALRQMEHE